MRYCLRFQLELWLKWMNFTVCKSHGGRVDRHKAFCHPLFHSSFCTSLLAAVLHLSKWGVSLNFSSVPLSLTHLCATECTVWYLLFKSFWLAYNAFLMTFIKFHFRLGFRICSIKVPTNMCWGAYREKKEKRRKNEDKSNYKTIKQRHRKTPSMHVLSFYRFAFLVVSLSWALIILVSFLFSSPSYTYSLFFIIGCCVCCRFLVLCVLYSCGRIYVNIKKENKV